MSATYDWLNLIEVSGPSLAVPVLREVFAQGLQELDPSRARRLRSAYEEWRDAVDTTDAKLKALHEAWIDEVFHTALEADESFLKPGGALAETTVELPEHGTTITPERVLVDPTRGGAVLAPIHVFAPDTDLAAARKFDGLSCSPGERMALHLRALNKPFGLVTNGEQWMLVYAPTGRVATFASWYARMWAQEPTALRAFVTLLGVRRFSAPEQERLPALFERSLKYQDEVTDALGDQVRRAIEVLVQALDRADQDRNRELLRDVKPRELYEAGLTVMMRLVFLLAAEERGLLLVGEPRYDSFYAASTLRTQLRAESDEILERRRAAWSRLLALFRAVFGGIDHPTLRLPAMGGSLFDPDRFPFLEGRPKGTSWRSHRAEPLPIDDRTVLLLLEAIQTFEGRTLSYLALDVEQIGHVYEGLLERTVARVEDVTLELKAGAQAKDARLTLGELESTKPNGRAAVIDLLAERSKHSAAAIERTLAAEVESQQSTRLLAVCRGDATLRDRLKPYVGLLRTDPWGYPLVHPKDAFVVMLGTDRRETGSHYTPKSLTERIVEETLAPLVYEGFTKGEPRAQGKPKTPAQLLDLKVCDPAMGSGAFLVQACRFLSARLVEAWDIEEAAGRVIDLTGEVHDGATPLETMAPGVEVRAENARRLVAERCLYGVDLNPLAVELAKLSLWLVTLSKGRPFGFLDHNLRQGDSLLGISRLEQLTELSLEPSATHQGRLFGRVIERSVAEAVELRSKLHEIPIRDIRDVEAMATLDADARRKLEVATLLADAFVAALCVAEGTNLETRLVSLGVDAERVVRGEPRAMSALAERTARELAKDSPSGFPRRPFHWPLEFPDVFHSASPGFDAIIGNPPFLNAIEHADARSEGLKAYYAASFPVFARGAYDLCLLFWGRALQSGLRESGRYGLLGPTILLSDGAPWKVWVHERWRPDAIELYPVDFFSKARIRTSAVIGSRGEKAMVRVSSLDAQVGLFPPTLKAWAKGSSSWYEAVASDGMTTDTTTHLQDIADVFAGCTTADAYNLRREVVDSPSADGLKLVTTGCIDRYASKWGTFRVRYLKNHYDHPRWPRCATDRGVERARERQQCGKILVGGLTAVIEAWFDVHGDSAGTVQTWVIRPQCPAREASSWLWFLTSILNSAYFSRVFVARYGAQAMNGRQITVKKKNLLDMPAPTPAANIWPRTGALVASLQTADTEELGASLVLVACALQQSHLHDQHVERGVLDKTAHLLASRLYGRSMEEGDGDYRWWCERTGTEPLEDGWSDLVTAFAPLAATTHRWLETNAEVVEAEEDVPAPIARLRPTRGRARAVPDEQGILALVDATREATTGPETSVQRRETTRRNRE